MTEIATGLALFAALALVGLGPLTWMTRSLANPGDRAALLGLAPAMGAAVTSVVAFPLYRYVGPVTTWALPTLAVLLVGSGVLSLRALQFVSLRRNHDIRALSLTALVVAAMLSAAPLTNGAQRVMFSHNPSDALTHLTLADTALYVPWSVLTQGPAWSSISSTPESAAILALSPTSLYSARFVVAIPIRLATMVDLAWLARVVDLGVERLLYPFALGLSLSASWAIYALCRLGGARHVPAAVAGVGSTVGYWAFMIRAHDAYSQVQVVPLLALLIAFWSLSVERKMSEREGILAAALALAASVVTYTEFTIVLLATLPALAFASWKGGTTLRLAAKTAVAVTLTACAMLAVSGQLTYHVESLRRQITFVMTATAPIGSVVFEHELWQEPLHAAMGTWWISDALRQGPSWLSWSAHFGSYVILVASWLSVAVVLLCATRRGRVASAVAAAAFVVPALAAISALVLKDDAYSFFKSYGTIFSLLLIPAASAANLRSSVGTCPWQGGAWASVSAGWVVLALQPLFALTHVATEMRKGPAPYVKSVDASAYDMGWIRDTLSVAEPKRLVVNVPPQYDDWWSSAFVMLAVRKYSPFFQSGYLIDNNSRRLYHSMLSPPSDADYILVSIADDYVGPANAGTLVAEKGALRLYRPRNVEPGLLSYRD